MSLNTTLCHFGMESFVAVDYADAYLENHPEQGIWQDLPGDEAAVLADKERWLVAASRMISRGPLASGPLTADLGWEAAQGLALPLAGHPVFWGVAEDGGESWLVDSSLSGSAAERFIRGSVRFESGEIVPVTGFDGDLGRLTLGAIPTEAASAGTPFALIEALPEAALQATCEQAIFLAGGPGLSILDEINRGVESLSAGGAGGGSLRLGAAPATGEICFAAQRLLFSAGLLRPAGSLPSGRS